MSNTADNTIKKEVGGIQLVSEKMKTIEKNLKEIQTIVNSFSKND